MKKYIKSNTVPQKPKRCLTIDICVVAFVESLNIAASEETANLPIANRKIADKIDKDFDEIVYAVLGILHSFGYIDLEQHKSPDSNSLYFTFCRESEFDVEEVTLIIRMRVSDHKLPRWRNDKSEKDAQIRLQNKLQEFADENRDLNKHIYDDESIETAVVLVEYEHEFYNTYEDMFKEIRKDLRNFKRKRGY